MSPTERIIAIIPARGRSKRIPHKNLLPIADRPLIAHSIIHAQQSRLVQEVIVSTDDEDIARVTQEYGAAIIWRPEELASDQATSESALLHVLDQRIAQGLIDPDLVVFLQATSPVRRPGDIDHAIETFWEEGADSLFSACENSRLIWEMRGGQLKSINYDYKRRQREQDMHKQYRENGSIYILRPTVLRKYNNRLGGKIAVYEMDYWSSFQIDTPEHVELLEWILQRPEFRPAPLWPKQIDLVVFDFDGVMTDNTVILTQDGDEAVVCSRADGWGIAQLHKAGIPMMVLSTEENPVVAARCDKLELPCHQGVSNKATYLSAYAEKQNIRLANVIYVGNDQNDLECLRMVGTPIIVADAHASVRTAAKLCLSQRGGRGAIREFADLLLGSRRPESKS